MEANAFHAEVLFSLASAAATLRPGCDISVYSHDYWGAGALLREELGVECSYGPLTDLRDAVLIGDRRGSFDAVLIGTYPLPDERILRLAFAASARVLALVHDIGFFDDTDRVAALLRDHEGLHLAHAGVAPAEAVAELPAELRRRVSRFFPVFRTPPAGADPLRTPPADRSGVVVPGRMEFSRRDYPTALRLAAEAGVPLTLLGQADDEGRRRVRAAIEASGIPGRLLTVLANPGFPAFYRALDASRYVAVMTVNPEYLHGKLTAAAGWALSCGVPMLTHQDDYDHYTAADPLFADCMVRFRPDAPAGHPEHWGTVVRDTPPGDYARLCARTAAVRDALLAQNARLIQGMCGTSGR
ncbi:hypothetical protein GCM10018793_62380 [Streptomyces sulfonofaciens]|uniref:Glycosyltransferase n=2 Tax=Streptomyces sulfonofaciens TaxID=68272 RepID=A0A919GMC9_9ACTN|nr:hypothetical protein GCM10018793_62380 [Streptomyces sulfonofaciens]